MKCNTLLTRALLVWMLIIPLRAQSIVDILTENDEFSTLLTAVQEAGLVDALLEADGITVFAPTNEAFSKVPTEELNAILADADQLQSLLLYHVVPEKLQSRKLRTGKVATLLPETSLNLSVKWYYYFFNTVKVNDSRVLTRGTRIDNGIVYPIDTVLDPAFESYSSLAELLSNDESYSTLNSLLESSGLDRALDRTKNYTILAPTNEAFAKLDPTLVEAVVADEKLLRRVLKNHLLAGIQTSASLVALDSVRSYAREDLKVSLQEESVMIGEAFVTEADVKASNGVLHSIDTVLVPEVQVSLAQTLTNKESLSTLSSVLDTAELTSIFDSERRYPAYTIFAPDNVAFAQLSDEQLAALLADPQGALTDVLKLHVVKGRVLSSHLYDGQKLTTLTGAKLHVSIEEGGVFINNAQVSEPDTKALNGVVHVIDAILEEAPNTVADIVETTHYLSTLNSALEAQGLDDVLATTDADYTLFAPSNRALSQLGGETITQLVTASDIAQNILLGHVIAGKYTLDELIEMGATTSVNGESLSFTEERFRFWRFYYSMVRVNESYVNRENINADNGFIHVIDAAILPTTTSQSF